MKCALLVVAALASSAFAERDPACPCETRHVVPPTNMVGVPTNALFWHLPSETRGYPIKPYALAPYSDFVIEGIPFTTGSGADTEPPIKPVVTAASIALMDNDGLAYQISRLHITATTSSDADVVHLRFVGTWGTVEYYTTPDNLTACGPPIDLTPGHVHLEVSAIDAAGNESEPDTIELDTTTDPHPVLSCTRHAIMDDTIGWRREDEENAKVVIALLAALLTFGTLIVCWYAGSHRRTQTEPSPFASLAVEHVARSVRTRALATIVLAGVTAGVAIHGDIPGFYAAAIVPVAAGFAIRAISHVLDARRVLRLHQLDGAIATIRYDEATVVVGKQRARVHASQRVIERARHAGLPKATL